MDNKLYTVKEVAQIMRVNVRYVYELIHSGLLPALKLGSWKVRASALDHFLEQYECYDLTDINKITKSEFYI